MISVDTGLYQNAGAGIAQQLAYGLAHANEYLNNFKNKINNSIVFKFSLSGNYFFEIAKLQAFRIIWDSLTKHHGNDINCHIVSSPSKRNKTIYGCLNYRLSANYFNYFYYIDDNYNFFI